MSKESVDTKSLSKALPCRAVPGLLPDDKEAEEFITYFK